MKVNYSNRKVNRLTLIHYIRPGGQGIGSIWIAQCDCGNTREVVAKDVIRGRVKDCGNCQLKRNTTNNTKDTTALVNSKMRRHYVQQMGRVLRSGAEWNLTPEDYLKISTINCQVCNSSLEQYPPMLISTNEKSYTPDTVLVLCRDCYQLKGKMTTYKFLEHIQRIHKYLVDILSSGI